MSVALGVIYLVLFIYLIRKWRFFNTQLSQKTLLLVFAAKFAVGLVLIAIYTFLYTQKELNDVYKYYQDSGPIYEELWNDPQTFSEIFFFSEENERTARVYAETNNWYRPYSTLPSNDNRLVIRLNVLLRILTGGGNIVIHALIVCFLMLISAVWLYKVFSPYTPYSLFLFLLVAFFPSLAFWTGAVMKESLLILGLSGVLYSIHSLTHHKIRLSILLLLALSILLMSYIKVYVLLLLLPGVVLFVLSQWLRWSYKLLIPLTVVAMISASYLLDYTQNNFIFSSIVSQRESMTNLGKGGVYFKDDQFLYYLPDEKRNTLNIQDSVLNLNQPIEVLARTHENPYDTNRIHLESTSTTYKVHFNQEKSGSYHEIPVLKETTGSLLKNVPYALVNSMLRPFPSLSANPLQWISIVENVFVITLIVLALIYNASFPTSWSLLIGTFGILLLLLVGWTTPIDGAIVRYRMPAFYLLSIWAFCTINWRRVPFIRKQIS